MWRAIFAVIVCSCSLSAHAANYALIMSIGEYQGGVTPLEGVRYDMESARKIAHKLGVADENITQLHDSELTLEGLRQAIDGFIKRVAANDEVFIYYSGHGGRAYVHDPVDRCAESLVTVNGQGFTDAELSLRLQQLSAKARRVIVFLDACHSGGVTTRAIHGAAGKKPRFAPKYWSKGEADACGHPSNIIVQDLSQKKRSLGDGSQNFVYISAARDDEVSFDEPGKGGLATQAWVKCMGAAADADGSGALTADEIRACAQQRINNEVEGAEGVKPHHIKIIGNANAVMALNSADVDGEGSSPSKAVNPYKTLIDIYNSRDDRRLITLKAEKNKLRIGHDKVEFTLTSTHAGYVYLMMVGSDGQTFDLLFPNSLDKGYRLEANETLKLPAPNWQITVQGPKGTDYLLAMVTDSPRDFSGLGAKPAGPFSVVDASIPAARDIQLVTSGKSQGDCKKLTKAMGDNCSDAYGAAILSLDEVE